MVTYLHKESLEFMKVIKYIMQMILGPSCSLLDILYGESLWVGFLEELAWCLTKIVDHTFHGLPLYGVLDGI